MKPSKRVKPLRASQTANSINLTRRRMRKGNLKRGGAYRGSRSRRRK